MMHKAWSSIEEVPYCFSMSSVKFQGHIALKIVEFDPNCAFPDCNSSLNSPMAMKCCTKLETAKKRCPIVFQGHPSNFKVTRDKTSPILTQIGRFRTIGRSQLSNPSDLPCLSVEQWPMRIKIYVSLLGCHMSITVPNLLADRLFVKQPIWANSKEKMKAVLHWAFVRGTTGDRCILLTNGQLCRKLWIPLTKG